MNSVELKNNPNFFSIGGVIGRADYLLCGIKLVTLMSFAVIPLALGSNYGSRGSVVGGTLSFLLIIPIIFFGLHAVCKRIRDIRGTANDEVSAIVVTNIFLITPYLGLIPFFGLFLTEGSITGSGNIFSKFDKETYEVAISAQDTLMDDLDNVYQIRPNGSLSNSLSSKNANRVDMKIAS